MGLCLTETTAVAETTGGAAAGGTTANFLGLLLLLMLVGSGIYCLYTYLRLRRELLLFPNKFLYPGNCPPENCVDVDGFIDFILPRLLIFGIALLLFAVAYGVLLFFVQVDSLYLDIGVTFLPVGLFVWYAIMQNKASKRFW